VLPALSAEWQIGPGTRLSWTASGLLGERRSVQFDRPATVRDTISHSTFAYSERQVDIDRVQSFTTELRLLQEYALFGETSFLSAGIQYIHNDLNRRQQGKGTTGSDYDLTISAAGWGRDLLFKTRNTAVFLENKFQVTPRLFFSPGVRVELGSSDMTGNVSYLPPVDVATTIKRSFPLFGVNAGYTINEQAKSVCRLVAGLPSGAVQGHHSGQFLRTHRSEHERRQGLQPRTRLAWHGRPASSGTSAHSACATTTARAA
jgi:Fe(3+) dicitrate transport protein